MAFHDVHTKIATPLFRRPSAVRPISSFFVPRHRDDVLFSLFWPQPSLLLPPIPSRTSNRWDVYHWFLEIAVADRSPQRHSGILCYRFYERRRAGCCELFKSFYYAMTMYIFAMSLI